MKTLSSFEQKSIDLKTIQGGTCGPSYSGGRIAYIACDPGGSEICDVYMEPLEIVYY